MKRVIAWLVVAAIGLLAYRYGPDALSLFQTPSKKEDPFEAKILMLAQEWAADARWQDRIKPRNYHGPYTLDIERVLLHTPGQRFLFVGTVEDVARISEDLFRVIVRPSLFWGSSRAEVWLDLTCRGEVVRPVFEAERESLEGYAILATIKEVNRPGFRVREVRSGEDTNIETEMPSERIAGGECLEFRAME